MHTFKAFETHCQETPLETCAHQSPIGGMLETVCACDSGRNRQSDDLQGLRKSFKYDPMASGQKPEIRANRPRDSLRVALKNHQDVQGWLGNGAELGSGLGVSPAIFTPAPVTLGGPLDLSQCRFSDAV